MAARVPASNSHPLLLFNPKIVAFFVCPGKNSALAEKAKFPLPLSGIPDSWNPKIGRYISQGSTRETKEIDIDIDVRRHYNCGGRSEIVVQSKDGAGLGQKLKLCPQEECLLRKRQFCFFLCFFH